MASTRGILILLALLGLTLSLASAWSTTAPVISRGYLPSLEATISSASVLHRSSRQHARDFSRVHAVQARAADMEDHQTTLLSLEEDDSLEDASSVDTTASDEEIRELTQKILNGIFLAISFGWAAHTILTIDAGMTRGWTQSEIAMRIPLDNWSNYESSLMEKPIFTKTLINVVIYLLGDWLSQTVFQKKNILDFDVSRTLKNGFIGLCFGPLVHEYYAFSDQILPVEGGLTNRVQKIFMDQTIYLTVKCSIYICAVGLLSGDSWDTCKQTVKDKIGGIVITAWKFWPLVHCITYGVIPARHRILWVNSVDLIWNAILATQAQKDQPQEETAGEEGQTETLLLEASQPDAQIPTSEELADILKTVKESSTGEEEATEPLAAAKEVLITEPSIEIADKDLVLVSTEHNVNLTTANNHTLTP